MQNLQTLVQNRVLMLDGAMGTMIQRYKLTEADYRGTRFAELPGIQCGNNDLLTLSAPHIIEDIHRKYLDAGADIIETNTFNAQRVSMADYGCQVLCREMNLAAAKLARRLADEYTQQNPCKPRFVAGSIGPTNRTLSMSPDANNPALRNLTFDELVEAYQEQIEALLEGGVDALLIETIFDTLNAKAALVATEEAFKRFAAVPVMLSLTLADKAGRSFSGQTLDAFWASVQHYPIFSVGLNCSFGADQMKPFLKHLSQIAPCYISAYPNAGLPNALGEYDQTPQDMARLVRELIEEGVVNIIGGCCGTTNEYIAAISQEISPLPQFTSPRQTKPADERLTLSGLETTSLSGDNAFLAIGERCNVAGSRKFLRLIKEKDYTSAIEIARQQVLDGAMCIDINLDDAMLDTVEEMTQFLNLLATEPEIARVPFMIDSSDWNVIEQALKCVQGKCIVNSLSLKEGEALFLDRARRARRYGAAIVVMAFDEQGQATTYERRIAICERAYHLLTEQVGMPAHDIIFDPNILAICTGIDEHDQYALDFIRTIEWIKQHFPSTHIVGGLSNLSFSFRGNNYIREAIHTVFLHHARAVGMDMAILNPSTQIAYEALPAELQSAISDALYCRGKGADGLIAVAEKYHENTVGSAVKENNECKAMSLCERLSHYLQQGNQKDLLADLQIALQEYPSAAEIIEGPLMAGMNRVGELFGAGQMFLPQVVKAARTMKAAVEVLRPHLLQGATDAPSRGKVLMATVKGDVHDIGKNIVAVVLTCGGFEVIDLGVMCQTDDIVQAAIEHQVDMVGLSALITPSLHEMEEVARAMQAAGLRIPLLIGGATTSKLHTALKISPLYDGPVFWINNASLVVPVATQLISPNTRDALVAQNEAEHQQVVERHLNMEEKPLTTLDEARDNRRMLF